MANKKKHNKRPAPTAKSRPQTRPLPPPRQGSRRGLLLIALGLAVVVVVGLVLANRGGDDGETAAAQFPGPACVEDSRMDTYSKSGAHTDAPGYSGPIGPGNNPQYKVNPPSGGDHLSRPIGPGAYAGDRVPPDGNLVHSLEHGYVIVWHKPDIPETDKAALRRVFDLYPRDTLIVERTNMEKPVAATAWNKRLLCDGVNEGRLAEFIRSNRNKAPEKVPH
jgi:hypothetical protein